MWHHLLTVVYDYVGLARTRVCTFLCVYTHTNPKIKPVLNTNILTRIANNINPNPILVIRPCVKGEGNIRPDSSFKAIHSSLSTTHNLTPCFSYSNLSQLEEIFLVAVITLISWVMFRVEPVMLALY